MPHHFAKAFLKKKMRIGSIWHLWRVLGKQLSVEGKTNLSPIWTWLRALSTESGKDRRWDYISAVLVDDTLDAHQSAVMSGIFRDLAIDIATPLKPATQKSTKAPARRSPRNTPSSQKKNPPPISTALLSSEEDIESTTTSSSSSRSSTSIDSLSQVSVRNRTKSKETSDDREDGNAIAKRWDANLDVLLRFGNVLRP